MAAATAAGPGVPPRSEADLPPVVVLLMASAMATTKHETIATPAATRTHHRRYRLLASSFWCRMVGWSSKSETPAPAPPAAAGKEESEVKMLLVWPFPTTVGLPVVSWAA